MYIIYVNHDSVIKQICQLRDKAFLINETSSTDIFKTNRNLLSMRSVDKIPA